MQVQRTGTTSKGSLICSSGKYPYKVMEILRWRGVRVFEHQNKYKTKWEFPGDMGGGGGLKTNINK